MHIVEKDLRAAHHQRDHVTPFLDCAACAEARELVELLPNDAHADAACALRECARELRNGGAKAIAIKAIQEIADELDDDPCAT